jgi:hypothetical protein
MNNENPFDFGVLVSLWLKIYLPRRHEDTKYFQVS